ncbi:gamma-glutamyltransferase [Altererythrobacter sp. ZODW24]|uniref:gamma-glutamyltransferase n=1 Tax=Altererythrobacter sp. ZODW24 TaxID=2185142 RepID=UPI000DF848D6|nr:gamma-glutamyltransferase [Altererythrobacter sp. ZODW24]
MIKRILLPLLIPISLAGCATTAPAPLPPQANGMVSAADPRAAEAGAAMLRQGGSATDAAIATMLALTVVEPQSSGIGGGGFYLRGAPDGTVTTIDGRETAPAAAGEDWFLDEDGKSVGYRNAVMTGLSIGVPGNLRLAEMAHEKYGRLEWEALFAPAIALASEGFELSPRGHEYLSRFKERAGRDERIRPVYFDETGEPRAIGTTIRNPELAKRLTRIANDGPQAFYGGISASAMAMTIREDTPRTGAMDVTDITSYQATPRDAVCGEYRGYRICGMGPPSSGATTVFAMLKQLESHDLMALGADNPTFWHLFAESQRLAYADRERYLADGNFVSVPVAGLMDGDYLASRGQLIAPDARMADVSHGTPGGVAIAPPDGDEPAENGTSHFVVVDGAGNAVSYTSTIEGPFGSGLTFGGFYLNNELTDFSFTPEKDGRKVANRVEGGKRPRSSMSPTLVYGPDGDLVMAIGAAGGSTIPVQVARGLIGMIDFGMAPADALALPVLFSPGDGVAIEKGSALEAMVPALEALGHNVTARALPLKANAARKVGGDWIGAADPRSEGIVAQP